MQGSGNGWTSDDEDGRRVLYLPPSNESSAVHVLHVVWPAEETDDRSIELCKPAAHRSVDDLTKPGPARWTKPITTQLEPGKDTGGPFVVDTLTLPYENPWNALFFVTGVDFLPDGRIAVCTSHGDVWTVQARPATRSPGSGSPPGCTSRSG